MAYKVVFRTFALLEDGKAGNVVQSVETIYTNKDVPFIKTVINEHLEERKRTCDILSIKWVTGECLPE